MPIATLETPDEDDIEVDSNDVIGLRPGREPDTTVIERDDGDDVVVLGTPLEVAAELGLDPSEYVESDEDGEEGYDEEEQDDD